MTRTSKALILVAGMAALLGITLVIATRSIDLDAYKSEVTQRFAEATGRELHIDGGIELGVSLVPSIVIEGLRLANAPWGSTPDMFSVARVEADLALLPLLMGDIEVRRLSLATPLIVIENDEQGVNNWDFSMGGAARTTAKAKNSWRTRALDAVEIRDASLLFRNGSSDALTSVAIRVISIDSEGPGSPMAVAIEAKLGEHMIHASGTLGPFGQLVDNLPVEIDLEASSGSTRLGIEGTIARPLLGQGLDFGITLASASLAEFAHLVDMEWPAVGPMTLTGRLIDTDRGHAITGLKLHLDDSDVSGNLLLEWDGRPRLTARLYTERIDLGSLLAQRGAKNSRRDKLFSPEPLPLDALASFDAEFTLDAHQIDTGNGQLENVEAGLALERGQLRLDPFEAQLAGGRVNAVATLTGEENGAHLNLELEASQIQPEQLPTLREVVSGAKTDITFEAEGTGDSIAAIMATLDGRLLVQTGKGTLHNREASAASADLLLETYRMLDPTAERDARTRLSCAVFHFAIDDGVAITDRGIALATERMNVIGSGIVDLDSERLDIGITTQAREGAGLSAGQLADLVRLGGTLANPEPTLDTEAAVMTGVAAGAAVATSGLSIVAQGLYDRLTADDTPCETALAMRVRDTRSAGDKAADAVKGVGEAIKGAFDSLFGD